MSNEEWVNEQKSAGFGVEELPITLGDGDRAIEKIALQVERYETIQGVTAKGWRWFLSDLMMSLTSSIVMVGAFVKASIRIGLGLKKSSGFQRFESCHSDCPKGHDLIGISTVRELGC